MLHYELEKKKGSSLYEELYQKLKEGHFKRADPAGDQAAFQKGAGQG